MHTCSGWYAAMAAGPLTLLPVAVLACPPLEVTRLDFPYSHPHNLPDNEFRVKEAYAADAAQALAVVNKAASMPRWLPRVRIEGAIQVRACSNRLAVQAHTTAVCASRLR